MSALLRSAKFLRLFGGIARSFTAPSARTEPDNFLSSHRQLWQGIDTRYLASQATAHVVQPDTFQSLEKALQKIDLDARNTGRIQSQDVEEIHAEVKATGAISGSQGLMLLRCCGNLAAEEMPEHRTQLALGIWQTLTSIGVPLDISHYNALLRVYLDNEHSFSPAEFLSYLQTQGVEPNRVTYQRLIYRYCMLGDIDGATGILGQMKENGLAINEDVFNSLIIGHARAKDLESAESMIGMMRRTSLEPSSETYRHLACAHADCGDIDGVQRALQLARDDEVLLRGRDLLEVVYSLTVAGYKDKLQEIMDQLNNTRLYNQDIVSVVLRLVNAGHDDVAFDMVRLMPHGAGPRSVEAANTGSFFIRQLVHINRDPSVVLDYCQKMYDLQLNDKAVLVALQRSLQRPQPGVAEAFLKALPAYGFQLRSHYFWPLIVRARHNKSYQDLLSVMQLMRSLNCFIGVDTMVEQVYPTLPITGVSFNKALYDMSTVGIGYQQTVLALCRYHLLKDDVKAAVEVANRYGVPLSHLPLLRPLAHQFGNPAADHQQRLESTLQMLHRMCEGVGSSGITGREMASSFLLEVLHAADRSSSSAVHAMAEAMLSRGLAVTTECATAIQTQLSANGCTGLDQLCRLLEQLSSEQLQPIGPAADFARSASTGVDQQSAGQSRRTMALDNNLAKAREEGGDLVIPLSVLFSKLTQIRNYKRAASIKKELEGVLDGPLPEKLLRSWCQLCISCDLLGEATNSFQQLLAAYPESLDDLLVLKLVRLMISEKQIDEAVRMLEEMPRDHRDELQREDKEYFMSVWRLLNLPSEAGDTATVRRLLQVLQQQRYVHKNQTRPLLALLIKSFICNNDLSGAMEEIESIYKEHRMLPGRSHLMAALIKAENPDMLQRVIEMSTDLSGEMETLYELAFSFIDCGKSRQAQKVLQTPGLRAQHRRLFSVCDGYLANGQVDRLEGLLTATREAFGVDRLRIYQYVLQAHCASGTSSPEQALAVWTRMQEEGLVATDAMMTMLARKLHQHNHPVPFQVPVDVSQPPPPFNVNSAPSHQQMTSHQAAARRPAQIAAVPQTTLKSQLKKALQANKLEEALQLRDRMIASSVDISVHDLSQMVEQLVRSDRLKEACDVTMHMLERDTFPVPRVLKFLLARLAAGGDVDTVTAFGAKLKDDLKSTLSYDNRLCTAFLSSGRGEEYLERLEATCKQMKSTGSAGTDGLVFPSGGFLGILRSMPQLHDRCVRLVHEFAERGVLAPANMLWAHHFVNGSYDEAQKIFDQHLQQKDVILFRVIVDKAVSTKDQQMAQRLYNTLQHSNISHIAKSVVFSALFNLSVVNDPPAVCLELFKNSGFKAEELKSSAREQLELLLRTQNGSSGPADTTVAST